MQTKQDQKLEEVRAILQRLQRISAGAEEDDAPPPPAAGNGAQSHQNGSALHGDAPLKPVAAMSAGVKIAAVALPVAVVLGAAGWWLSGADAPETAPVKVAAPSVPQKAAVAARPEPAAPARRIDPVASVPAVAVAPAGADTERLAIAQALMDKGKVTEARRVLNNDLAARSAEGALLLARAYDPNSLQLIANADAGADPAEAERWYRRWSELAAAQGLELDRERLDRIIKAMR